MMRLVHDDAQDGTTNMARDEAMLIEVGNKSAPPTLRFYQWSPPTISLGYFQKYADYEALPAPAGELPVVRRLTGGGAILHDLELTYSIALPLGHELLSGGANHLYELAHDAVIASLEELGLTAARCGQSDDSGAARGPFFCFERRHCYDVLLGGDKIAGSAAHHAVLQHGSIVLKPFASNRQEWLVLHRDAERPPQWHCLCRSVRAFRQPSELGWTQSNS
jgi:lipoate-protein ligase A